MQWLSPALLAIQVISSLTIIALVLLQQGKGADMGSSFGGGSAGSLFGATGAANFLSRATKWAAIVFFASTIGLAYVSHRPSNTSAVEGGVMQGFESRAVPAVPGSATPAAPGNAVPSVPGNAPAVPGGNAVVPAAPEAVPAKPESAPADKPVTAPEAAEPAAKAPEAPGSSNQKSAEQASEKPAAGAPVQSK